ncbi:hypothetical protein ACT3UJ_02145 [Halomonas sp. 86]|uniref:hypothetical protein n=1 Tax=unclassified Halomonas TaxID=2609666 RepID=UPI0040336EEC
MEINDDNATERYRQIAQEAHDDAMMYRDKLEAAELRIAELEQSLERQAKAAISGMDAAKAVASSNLEHATRLHSECSPEALESERAANALLTERVAELEEREQSLWETLVKIADHIGIDYQAARGRDGKPSDVYIEHINRVKTLAQADELANCCDILTDKGHVDAAIEVHSLNQERRQQAEA